MFELVITADTNDADYVTSTHTVTEEQIKEVDAILTVIGRHHNWENGDQGDPFEIYKDRLTFDQIEMFNDLVPHGEHGIHTISKVVYYPMPEKVVLL